MSTAPTQSIDVASPRSSVQLATELLGGRRVLHRQVSTAEDAHDLVLRGIPAEAMARLVAGVLSLPPNVLLATIGVSLERPAIGLDHRKPIVHCARIRERGWSVSTCRGSSTASTYDAVALGGRGAHGLAVRPSTSRVDLG